jgi:Tfp pilus assembly protein PilF
MKNIHIVSALLLGNPFLQSCTSGPIPAAPQNVGSNAAAARGSAESPAMYYQLGRYYQGQNRLDAAAAAYEKALAVDSKFYEARNGLGVILSARGKHDLAIEQFRAAIAHSSQAGHLHNNLGQAYYLQGRYQDAISSFETAAALNPHNYGTLARLSQAYAKAGMPEQSQQALRRAQSYQAQSALATESVLGRPGALAAENSASAASAAIERTAASSTPATRAVAVSTASAPVQPVTSSVGSDAIVRRSDTTGKLEPVSPGVFELALPGSVAPRPASVTSALPLLAQPARPAIPMQKEPSRRTTLTSAASTDVKVTAVSPGIYQLEASPPAASPAPVVPSAQLAVTTSFSTSSGQAQAALAPPTSLVTIAPALAPAAANSAISTGLTSSVTRVRVEVSNGNGIRSLAKRVSARMREFEHYVARLTNQRPPQSATTVEYRDGYIEEAASVAAGLQQSVALVPSNNLRRDIHVRLVLGKDVRNELALFPPLSTTPHRIAVTADKMPVAAPYGLVPGAKTKSSAKTVSDSIREAGKRPAAGMPTPANISRPSAALASEQVAASR